MNQLINILSEIQVIGGNHKFKLCEEFIGDSVLESFFWEKANGNSWETFVEFIGLEDYDGNDPEYVTKLKNLWDFIQPSDFSYFSSNIHIEEGMVTDLKGYKHMFIVGEDNNIVLTKF